MMLIALAALATAAACVGLLTPVARRLGAMATVSSDRWHRNGSVPRLAGPGLLLAVLP